MATAVDYALAVRTLARLPAALATLATTLTSLPIQSLSGRSSLWAVRTERTCRAACGHSAQRTGRRHAIGTGLAGLRPAEHIESDARTYVSWGESLLQDCDNRPR